MGKRIFQAGHVAGVNSWEVCGTGSTIEAARKDLKRIIHVRALKFCCEGYLRNDGKTPDAFLEKNYIEWAEYLQSSRYVETSFIDENEDDFI